MVQGISKNPLTDISKVYLEQVSIDERLGGKGYKRRKDYAGRTVEGDWPDSDRGGGHKAKKRAGGKVEKKSPTYRAYVLNKEEVVDEDTKRTTKGRWVDKKGRSHKFAVTTHTGDETHVSSIVKSQYPAKRVVITGQSADKKKKDAKKKGKKIKESVECDCKGCGQDPCIKCGESHHSVNETVSGGVPMTPQELEIQKKMSKLNMRLARKRNAEMQKAKIKDTETAPEQVKEDKAYANVLKHLKGKYGSNAVLGTGEKPKDTRSEKSKRKATRKRAASDEKERRFKKRNPAVTSGRYPKDDEKAWAAAREREKREGIS